MKSYYNKDTNCILQVCFNKDVALPNDSDDVELTRYAKNELLCIKRKSHYSEKIKVCCDTDTLINELTKTSSKKRCNNSDNHKKSCDNSADTSTKKVREKGNKKSCNNSPELENCIEKNGAIIDVETGEIIERCRRKDSMRKSWYRAKEHILNNVDWRTALFISINLDTKPNYDEMSNLASGYTTYIKTPFKGRFECGVTFLEPCEDGSWHVHLIIGFKDFIPQNFEEKLREWWAKRNNNKTEIALEHQTKLQLFDSLDDLVKVINYLNPTSKKKRDRIKYYPLSSQPIRKFGKTSEPKKAITTFETAKKIAGSEKPAMRKKVIVIDAEIKAVLFEISEYYFDCNIVTYQRQCKKHISENVIENEKTIFRETGEERDNSRWQNYVYDNYTMQY